MDHRVSEVFAKLGELFYQQVPLQYRTYCSLTSRISQQVLRSFGIAGTLVHCQVWCVTETENYVVGFLGKAAPGKWDGHVICVAGGHFIDAALHHFQRDFSLPVPDVVSAPIFAARTTVISRFNLTGTRRLWWHPPPAGSNSTPPAEPQDFVERHAADLAAAIRARLAA